MLYLQTLQPCHTVPSPPSVTQCKKWSHCLQYQSWEFVLILYTNRFSESQDLSLKKVEKMVRFLKNAKILTSDSSCSLPTGARSSQLLWKASPTVQGTFITSNYIINSAVMFLVPWLSHPLINPRLKGKNRSENEVNTDRSHFLLFFFSLLTFPNFPVLTSSFCQWSSWLCATSSMASSIHLTGMPSPPEQ